MALSVSFQGAGPSGGRSIDFGEDQSNLFRPDALQTPNQRNRRRLRRIGGSFERALPEFPADQQRHDEIAFDVTAECSVAASCATFTQ